MKVVKGYENNPGINVEWDHLNETSDTVLTASKEKESLVKASPSDQHVDKVQVDNISVINSFGQKFDEIKSEQVLQVAADITNFNDKAQNFIYMVEIKNESNDTVQPAKWMTGTLNSHQTLNVGLSWIPKETGQFRAIISTGNDIFCHHFLF